MAFPQKLVIVVALAILGVMYQDVLAQSSESVPTTTATTTTTTSTASTTTASTSTSAAPSLCAGAQPTTWDKCTAAGTFKSVSYCYFNTNAAAFVYRYDFFKCVRSSLTGGWFMYRQNCTGPTPIVAGEPFNRFNPSSGKCDLPVPSTQ